MMMESSSLMILNLKNLHFQLWSCSHWPCGYMLDHTRLILLALRSRLFKILLQFLSYEKRTTLRILHKLFLFQGYVNFNILARFFLIMRTLKYRLNAGFTTRKVFIDILLTSCYRLLVAW